MNVPVPTHEPTSRHERAWAAFHASNPQVYRILCDLAMEGVRSGHRRLGIGMLWEVMRWRIFLETSDHAKGGRKLNNNHRAYYARLMMECEPELAGVFELRELRLSLAVGTRSAAGAEGTWARGQNSGMDR